MWRRSRRSIRRKTCRGDESHGCGRRPQAGAVTAEFAVILPAVAALAVLVCALGRAVVLRIECQDAAHVIAQRIVAQMQADPAAGELQPAVTQWAEETTHRLVNGGASVSLAVSDDGVDVRVSARVVPDPLRVLPATVTGYAFACAP